MASEVLDFNATTVKQTGTTDGIHDWLEINSTPHVEVFRVVSNESGDWFFCRKINTVKAVLIQNHGATFATGVARDPPKVTVTQSASSAKSAKITITHTSTRETFTVVIIGDL